MGAWIVSDAAGIDEGDDAQMVQQPVGVDAQLGGHQGRCIAASGDCHRGVRRAWD